MNVDTLCNTYQRKMWKSMISRKKLNINIWDAIKYKKENVYYMPYSGIHKFEVTTRYCLRCGNELEIGFRKNKFIVGFCQCTADGKKFATVEKLTTIFNTCDAKNIIQTFSDCKTRKFPNMIKYWVDQGLGQEEAEENVSKVQTERSNKSPASKKGARGYSGRTKEYWINRGYTENEAHQKISKLQVTNGIDWYISRYGNTEGKVRYQKRIKQWLASYRKALENDPTINERKMVSFSNASKESLNVFLPLYNKYKNDVLVYIGIDESNEYFLRDGKSIYFYDFTIPSLKIIVEYNGSKFHPNVGKLTEEELSTWRGLFSNAPADVVIAKDTAKRKLAEHNGYIVLTIWDTDDINTSVANIDNIIKERLHGN